MPERRREAAQSERGSFMLVCVAGGGGWGVAVGE